MANVTYTQSTFTRGQLDERVQARYDYDGYQKAARILENVLVIPQGGVENRFGTTYIAPVNVTEAVYFELSSMVYNDDEIYLFVWTAGTILVYFEDILLATVSSTPYAKEDIANLRFIQVETRIIVVNPNLQPYQLSLNAQAPNQIIGSSSVTNTFTITSSLTVGTVYPAQFTTTGTLPITNPQIFAGRRYYVVPVGAANTIRVFGTSEDAAAGINYFTISSGGTLLNNVLIYNAWALTPITFKNYPAYDFGNYPYFNPSVTFTPNATSGNVIITSNLAMFDSNLIGGLFTGDTGIVRITGVASSTQLSGYTVQDFSSTAAIMGPLAFLGQPAWSNALGWPRAGSFFQNRLVLGGTATLPNGTWLSVTNDVYNFDDSETFPDNAISWYPASNNMSYVRAYTASKSLLIHTNTGNYSTPLTTELPITPENVSFTEQNKDGVNFIAPVVIDNQVIFVDKTDNNIKSMVWEIIQSSYILKNISVISSSTIEDPIDMTAFSEPSFTDGSYVLLVNGDGTLAIYQTLLSENVAAWTSSNTTQEALANSFVKITSALDQLWFGVQRYNYSAQSPVSISAFSSVTNSLTATAHGMPIGQPSLIQFTTTGTLPLLTPAISVGVYYWAVALDANTFQVYGDYDDALALASVYIPGSFGSNSLVVYYLPVQTFTLEALDFNVNVDSATTFTNNNSATITGLSYLEGQNVQVFADGYVFPDNVVTGGQITLPQVVNNGFLGYEYVSTVGLLPINNTLASGNNFYNKKLIRRFYLYYFNSLGLQINGMIIPTQDVQSIQLDTPPPLETGVYEYEPMTGWDEDAESILITQSLPLPFTILGIGYDMELDQ